ncbi:DUF7504 family protein [Halovivax limisalsi]|uniref:DUF7504 family protein n=1 Tax=Halovivax limisalsi TaxID=1453760 RepID=UPI001FFD70B4|nr:hypothetical protein [Halovivax limisalsi]
MQSIPPFPAAVSAGSTVLVAGTVDPSNDAIGLRMLCRYGDADDAALVVTSTETADETTARYESVCPEGGPSIGLVDTQSKRQYLSSLYGPTPTVYTPSTADLERIVIALAELTETAVPPTDARHLVVRSVTPLLEHASVDRVCNVLRRISGLRTGGGICYVGIHYTEHDQDAVAELARQADGIVWVTRGADRDVTFDYQPARSYVGPIPDGDS